MNHNICLAKIATVTVFTNHELSGAFEVIYVMWCFSRDNGFQEMNEARSLLQWGWPLAVRTDEKNISKV